MSDITKCSGNGCPIKEKCYRFTAKTFPKYQSFFTEPPLEKDENGNITCKMFWGENSEQIFQMLKKITE